MPSSKRQSVPIDRPPAKQRKCSVCGVFGHNKRKCPAVVPAPVIPDDINGPVDDNSVTEGVSPAPSTATVYEDVASVDWDNVLYVVFDLETTGVRKNCDEIIELAAIILDKNGIQIEDATFVEFVKPTNPIPPFVTMLTSITNDDVSNAESFAEVGGAFIRFMQKYAITYDDDDQCSIDHIILVGHNGKVFDIPFFINQLCIHDMDELFLGDDRFGFGLDSMRIAKESVRKRATNGVPSAYNLKTLYQFVTGKPMESSHRALDDVKATITVLRHEAFWEHRKEDLFIINGRQEGGAPPPPVAPVDDADARVPTLEHDDSGDDGSVSSSSSESDDDSTFHQGNRWKEGVDYNPGPEEPMQRFQEYFTSTGRSKRERTGLQCSPIDVNTPIRAWRELFKNTILEKIVKYTNEYGRIHAKAWSDITRKDLEAFIAILFISGIQKRKDKPSHWFSDNKLLENPVVKKIMSGRKFFTILRFLHCCPAINQDPSSATYDPAYKVAELRDYLEDRSQRLFVPGQQLSLDETLIRAFGRIKFKVRIVTKAARYGIKIYVITDAQTAYVLRVVFYTGKATYYNNDSEDKLKTVQIVNKLVEPFVGSHRTIYVDRFYTSLDLLISLAERDLYITGTMLANRIPPGIRIAKTAAKYKRMKRGDAVKCKVVFTKADGQKSEAGLVCWRDRNIVYCLSNDSNNFEFDECCRRGDGGIIRIPRPISIAQYNKFMGGVDLADMKRLHCNSTIMGQNRWWLKLFFYLLDVGTSNALVLYNEQLRIRAREAPAPKMNIVQFKMQLVVDLVGRSITDLFDASCEHAHEHVAVPIEGDGRSRCAYCALMSRVRRTRYQCTVCGVPLCTMGSGKVESDCFSLAHETEDRRQMVCTKFQQMQKKNTKQK